MIRGAFPIASAPIASAGSAAAAVPPTTSERFLLLTGIESDDAAISASSEVTGLPATNLLDMQPAKKWRSDGATEVTLSLITAFPVEADTLFLVGHNLSATALVRVSSTSLGLDTGWQSAWPTSGKPLVRSWPHFITLLRWLPLGAATDWDVQIADPSNAYLEAGRLMIGAAWQPSFNFDIGGTPLGFDPVDVQTRTPYGRTFTDRRASPRLFELAIFALTKREAFDGIYEIQRQLGLWGDVVCCLDPGETTDLHRFTLHGVFTERGAYTLPAAFDGDGNMYGAAIRLRELI